MKKLKIYHNQYGYGRPQIVAKNGYEFNFSFEKISEKLKSKLFGKNGEVELSIIECRELLNAK